MLSVVREMGPEGSNVGSIADILFERDALEIDDRPTVYRRTMRALRALQELGLIRKVGLNYIAEESKIQDGLLKQLMAAFADVASTSFAAADVGILRAALQGVMDEVDNEAKVARIPMVGTDLASRILDE